MSEKRRRLSYMLRLWQAESEGTLVWRASLESASVRLGRPGERRGSPKVLARLRSKVAHYRSRLRMRRVGRARRLPIVLKELILGRYFRYSINWKAIPQDVFL